MRNTAWLTAVIATAAAVLPTSTASAQSEFSGYNPSSEYTQPSYPQRAPTSRMRHSSTVHEGVGRAISNIIRAYTDGLISAAQARILIAEANAREYQLRVVNTATFLERQQLLEDARAAKKHRKFEDAQLAQARREQREENELYSAYKLPESVLNHANGRINWPTTLERNAFVSIRSELNELFAQLAEEGAQYDRLYRDPICDLVVEFRERLERGREALEIDWEDYLASQKLLVGLKYEAENWPSKDKPERDRLLASR